MTKDEAILESITTSEYKYGFETIIEADEAPMGLDESTIRFISAKKNEPDWLLEDRLRAFRMWQEMIEPHWPNVKYPKIDYQAIKYYSAPKQKKTVGSLDEIDPELIATFNKLGISLSEQKRLAGVVDETIGDGNASGERPQVAVDVVMDSISVATTFKKDLAERGIIFCSISEAVQEYPELVRNTWGQ